MEKPPPIHEQFREIFDFVHKKCEEEAKLILLHALDEDAPACEMIVGKAKFEMWEDPGLLSESLAFGIPGRDFRGNITDQFNFCPYCNSHVWTSLTCPVGAKLECLNCRAHFARNL